MLLPKGEAKRSNPRTISEFLRVMKDFPSIESKKDDVLMHAHSLLDEETITSFMVFATRDVEMTVEPEEILKGEKKVYDHIKNLMERKDPRIDIISVICERLYSRIVQPDCEASDTRIANFQKFLTMKEIPDDTCDSLCRRLARRRESNAQKWLLGNKELRKRILDNLH
jgi:hypothetical protein